MSLSIILSHYQVRPLLQKRPVLVETVLTSPDLGLSQVEAPVEPDGIRYPGGGLLTWEAMEEISRAESSCFLLQAGKISKIKIYSEATNRLYSLMPTSAAPTMLLSGIPMHRIKETTPDEDTRQKIKTLRPLVGRVLDTATGLGYTAVEAAKTADEVITVEYDPAVIELARQNPWSRALFASGNIIQRLGDSFEVIADMEPDSFRRIIHDPPVMSLAGELYSTAFYRELYRILESGGRLFHYIGNPASRSGANTTRGVMARLKGAGFLRVARRPDAFGVVAYKGR